MGILVIGSIFVDIKGYPLAPYIPAGRNVGRVETVHGGVCRNVVEDIAKVHLRPRFLSLTDQSGTGREVVERLKLQQCDTDYILVREGGLGTWLAVFDNSGDVVASISWRPDLLPLLDMLNREGDKLVSECDSIVVEIDMDEPTIRRCLELGKKYGKEVYAVVSNMSIALERRRMMRETGCVVCNQQEAGILFSENYDGIRPEVMASVLADKVKTAGFKQMVVTMGSQGSVWAMADGSCGICPATKVDVKDTTGAGDAFFAGVAIGLTYHKSLAEACVIGTRLAASVIATTENVCPSFMPEEFGINL